MAHILFVDDDFFTLETYDKIISLYGHQAILAQSAAQALKIAAEQSPDLIVVDMRLPDVDGFELLKQLKSNPKTAKIPAVMVSAGPDLYAEQAKAAGAQHYLSKPIYPERLLEIIKQNAEKMKSNPAPTHRSH